MERGNYKVISGQYKGNIFKLEGSDKDIWGKSWMDMGGLPVCWNFAIRAMDDKLDMSKPVYYGKIGALGYLVNADELELIEE